IGHSPTAMLKFLEELRGLENLMINAPEYDLDNEGWGSGGPIGYPLLEVLAVASLVIEKEGWKSNHTAREEFSMSTSHFCGYLLSYSANQEKKLFKQRHGTCDPSEENWEEAKKVKEWMLSNEKSESNYLYNLSLIAKGYYCEPKNTGFAVSAVSAYQREIEKSSMAKEPKLDEWFGKVGEKYGRKPKRKSDIVLPKVDLKLVSCRPFEGYGYGGYPQVKYLCLFKDREGRTFKWWTTAEMPDPGDWYSCAFEVKAHEEYKDNKQTLITRAVLHPIEEKEVCNA
ncbi:MAG: hypothetical protein KDH96_06890, partial [Candidatus Riesia sp.]|nr:hypothetical protein [Candidatus Riesia sp.]